MALGGHKTVVEMGTIVVRTASFDVLVSLHTAENPMLDEWALFLDLIRGLRDRNQGRMDRIRTFVVSDGGAPGSAQRALLNEATNGQRNKFSVVSISLTNPIKRGIATAVSWINPGFHAYLPEAVDEALAHVDCSDVAGPILAALRELQTSLPANKTLALIERQLDQSLLSMP